MSFVANTNWQGYSGEQTMSYLTQMLGLACQNFFSAATGIAVIFALVRGFSASSSKSIGNFWVDLVRSTLYILLPLSLALSVVFMGEGVIQNFSPYKEVTLLDQVNYETPKTDAAGQAVLDAAGKPVMEAQVAATQTIAMGPVASQEVDQDAGHEWRRFFQCQFGPPV